MTPFQTELGWIVGTVTRNIAATCLAAREPGGRLPADSAVNVTERSDTIERYDLRIEPGGGLPPIAGTFPLPNSVWWPGGYADVARAARAQWCPAPGIASSPAAAPTAPAVMTTLLQLDPAVIVAQSQALSARLSANMLDAAAHDEAALLLGTFALREAVGSRPTHGVHISSSSPVATRADIRQGDVIVALDGWRVDNPEQDVAARGFADEEAPLGLVIWRRGEGWLRRRVSVPGRRFGVDLAAYPLPYAAGFPTPTAATEAAAEPAAGTAAGAAGRKVLK